MNLPSAYASVKINHPPCHIRRTVPLGTVIYYMKLNSATQSRLLTFVDKVTSTGDIEQGKNTLGFILGYYIGNSLSVTGPGDESNQLRFTRQYANIEPLLVSVNELRPVNLELAKDLARTVFLTRCRVAQGGLGNLHLNDTELSVLNVTRMVQVVLKSDLPSTLDNVNTGLALLHSAITANHEV